MTIARTRRAKEALQQGLTTLTKIKQSCEESKQGLTKLPKIKQSLEESKFIFINCLLIEEEIV